MLSYVRGIFRLRSYLARVHHVIHEASNSPMKRLEISLYTKTKICFISLFCFHFISYLLPATKPPTPPGKLHKGQNLTSAERVQVFTLQ